MKSNLYTIEVKGKNPFVVVDLNEYRSLLDKLEDMEDRLAIRERMNDEDIPWEEVKKDIRKKLSKNTGKK